MIILIVGVNGRFYGYQLRLINVAEMNSRVPQYSGSNPSNIKYIRGSRHQVSLGDSNRSINLGRRSQFLLSLIR